MTLRSKNFNDIVTFTRDSEATFVDSDGLIKTALANQPRFDHDPVTGESLGLLVEEQRTNFSLKSDRADRHFLFGGGATVEEDPNHIAPDGSNAFLHTATAGQSAAGIIMNVTENVTYTVSAYLKINPNGGRDTLQFNFDNAILGPIFPITNEFKRYSFTFTSDRTGSVNIGVKDFGSSFYIWGFQLEVGSFPTSYIPTNGSQVTRTVERAVIENAELFYNNQEGTLFVDARVIENDLIPFAIQPFVFDNSTLAFDLQNNNRTPYTTGLASGFGKNTNQSNYRTQALTFTKNSSASYFDGKLSERINHPDAAFVDRVPTKFTINEGFTNGNGGFSATYYVKSIKYFPRALTDLEIIQLMSRFEVQTAEVDTTQDPSFEADFINDSSTVAEA